MANLEQLYVRQARFKKQVEKQCDLNGIQKDEILVEIFSRKTSLVPVKKVLKRLLNYGDFNLIEHDTISASGLDYLFGCGNFILKRMWSYRVNLYKKYYRYIVPTFWVSNSMPNRGGTLSWVFQPKVIPVLNHLKQYKSTRLNELLDLDFLDVSYNNIGDLKGKLYLFDW